MNNNTVHFAVDGNEANVSNRVGSNVYAFEILKQLFEFSQSREDIEWTVLLAQTPLEDFPAETHNWHYRVVGPRKFWTQWALPLHLYQFRKTYNLLYTPGHYAPRFSSVPYVSSVMDLAFLHFPKQFTGMDAFQLKHWTDYSVQNAQKVITISEFSKKEIHSLYGTPLKDIVVAPPSISLESKYSPLRWKRFLKKNDLRLGEYFLYLGTVQPRKNLEKLIEAFEIFCRFQAADQLRPSQLKQKPDQRKPQLVIAGKTGWLADGVLKRREASPLNEDIILTGYIDNSLKRPLYENAVASVLVGTYEGFGIPPLESLSVGTPAIVSNTSSLPEAVGSVGALVSPEDPHAIAHALKKTWNISESQKQSFQKKAHSHVQHFTWEKTGKIVIETLLSLVNKK